MVSVDLICPKITICYQTRETHLELNLIFQYKHRKFFECSINPSIEYHLSCVNLNRDYIKQIATHNYINQCKEIYSNIYTKELGLTSINESFENLLITLEKEKLEKVIEVKSITVSAMSKVDTSKKYKI